MVFRFKATAFPPSPALLGEHLMLRTAIYSQTSYSALQLVEVSRLLRFLHLVARVTRQPLIPPDIINVLVSEL